MLADSRRISEQVEHRRRRGTAGAEAVRVVWASQEGVYRAWHIQHSRSTSFASTPTIVQAAKRRLTERYSAVSPRGEHGLTRHKAQDGPLAEDSYSLPRLRPI
jgi:hypothetical protein